MILYLDTSAILVLYADEAQSSWTQRRVNRHLRSGGVMASSSISYVETRAAFVRMLKRRPASGAISREFYEKIVAKFDADVTGARWVVFPVTAAVVERAAAVTDEHALRAYDALQLATVLTMRDELAARHASLGQRLGSIVEESDEGPAEVLLLTFEDELFEAALAEDVAYVYPGRGEGRES